MKFLVVLVVLAVAGSAMSACPKGKVGLKCQKDDPCVTAKCKTGELCSVDDALNAVCACPLGFGGAKCAERQCPIVTPKKGSGIFFDKDFVAERKEQDMKKQVQACGVEPKPLRSFTKLQDPQEEVSPNEMALYLGKGLEVELYDTKGKLLCDKKCFSNPSTSRNATAVACVLGVFKKAGLVHDSSNPGVVQDRVYTSKDKDLVVATQVGCHLNKEFPWRHLPIHALVGDWKLTASENWDEFLKENGIGWWKRIVINKLKPDVFITNEGKNWVISAKSTFKNIHTEYTEGVEFEGVSPMSGDKTRTTATLSPNKDQIIEHKKIFSHPPRQIKIIREVINDKYVQTMWLNGVKTKRTYSRMA